MTRWLVYGGLLVVATVLAVAWFAFRIEPAVYAEDFELEQHSLEAIDGMLSRGFSPLNSDMAIGLSEGGLSELTSALEGVSARTEVGGGLVLSLQDVEVEVRDGYVPVLLSVKAVRDGSSMEAVLTVHGAVFADRIERIIESPGAVARIHYRVAVREIGGSLSTGALSLATRNWVNRVIASNVGRHFVENLAFSFPIELPMEFGLSFSEETTQAEGDGRFTIRYWMDAPSFSKPRAIRTAPGVPGNGAVWFLASLENVEEKERSIPGEAEDAQDSEDGESLRERVLRFLSRFPEVHGGVAVHLNRAFLDKIVGEFNGLGEEERTIRAELRSSEGNLKESFKELGVLGRGGYAVRFPNKGHALGIANISTVSSEWNEGKGLALSGRVSVRAGAVLPVHIDPFVGGGFDTDIGLIASARVPLRVDLDARLVESGVHAAVVIGPAVRCERFRLKLEEKGADILGIELDQFVGKSQPQPWSIIGSRTLWTQLIEKGERGELTLEDHWIGVRTVPTSVVAGSNGYRIVADIESELSVARPEEPSALVEHGEFEAIWRKAVQRECPEKRDPVFLFAGHDFGPNNELVKAVKGLAKAIDRTGTVAKATAKQIETVLKDPLKAPEVAVEILGKAEREVGRAIDDVGDLLEKGWDKVK